MWMHYNVFIKKWFVKVDIEGHPGPLWQWRVLMKQPGGDATAHTESTLPASPWGLLSSNIAFVPSRGGYSCACFVYCVLVHSHFYIICEMPTYAICLLFYRLSFLCRFVSVLCLYQILLPLVLVTYGAVSFLPVWSRFIHFIVLFDKSTWNTLILANIS